MRSKKTNKIKYGKKDLLDASVLDPKNQMHKITMWIEGDLLLELKERAAEVGAPYQTYLKKLLRDALDGESITARVSRLEKKLAGA